MNGTGNGAARPGGFFGVRIFTMSGIRKFAQGFVRVVDSINSHLGFISYALPLMTFIMTYEVIARFVFNAPTIWAWDVNTQLLAFIAVLSGGYVLFHNGHTRMDLFSSRWSARGRAYMNTFTYLLGLLFLVALLVKSFGLAEHSLLTREYGLGLLKAPLYPLRIIIVLGIALFIIQLLAEMIRNLLLLTGKPTGEPPAETRTES